MTAPGSSSHRDEHPRHAAVVVDDGTAPCSRAVMVAVDDSDHSDHALRWALQNLARAGDALLLVHVQPKTPLFKQPDTDVMELILSLEERMRTDSRMLLIETVSKVRKLNATVKIKAISAKGDARNVLLDVAKVQKADMVVIGSRGFSKLKGSVFGSVSQYLVHHLTDVPVIVVKLNE
ncbi:hypothetical protein BC830DRAFT_1173175 [Chytriomyces sp. MP71]|nr:hypothetical protein BC830DRAFT_1173175 [Chytriomyces sp. MP71]